MRRLTFAIIVAVPTISFAAPPPDNLRYSYVDLTVSGGEIEVLNIDIDTTQASVSGSWGVSNNIALFAGFSGGEVQTSEVCFCTDIDTAGATLGINPHFEVANNVDIVIPVAFQWVELDDGFDKIDETGYSIGLGLRALVSPSWELGVGVTHVDIDDEDEQTVSGSVRWHIVELFSLAVGAGISSDAKSVGLNGRFTF
jgi:hypothetical protein